MRRAAKVDDNQAEIVAALTAAGAKVQSLSQIGQGVPDLLVGYQGRLMLVEVKDGNKIPSSRKLTDDQQKWHGRWEGYPVHIVETVAQALELI